MSALASLLKHNDPRADGVILERLVGLFHVRHDGRKNVRRDRVALREDDAAVILPLEKVRIEKLRFAVPTVLRAFGQVLRKFFHFASPCVPARDTTAQVVTNQPPLESQLRVNTRAFA